MKKKKFISETECNELVREYKERHNLKISETELKNHHLDVILGETESKLESSFVSISLSELDKKSQIKSAVESGKDILFSATGRKDNYQPLVALYAVREMVEADAELSNLDIFEDYSYNNKTYNASICLKRRG